MGAELELFVNDNSIDSPYLSKRFLSEIIFENYITFTDFLTEKEIKIINPNPDGEIYLGEKKDTKFNKIEFMNSIINVLKENGSLSNLSKLLHKSSIISEKLEDRQRNPQLLIHALKKVESYLKTQETTLPVVHSVFKDYKLEDEICYVLIGNIECHIHGDNYCYENYSKIRNSIHIRSYYENSGKVDFYIEVKPEIFINNIKYFTKTISKAEQFKEEFSKCYSFLKKAIEMDKKILWEFG